MSILIPGMKMPKEKSICVRIFADGGVHEFASPFLLGLASELPPHGRLIDADALPFVKASEEPDPLDYVRRYAVDSAPTIIPADPEKDGDAK